jgi:hypothetical protein
MTDTTDTATASLAEQVIDPEEFNRRRRFRQIHEAKQRVSAAVADIEVSERGELYVDEEKKIGQLVALYVHELLPLIEQSTTVSDGDMVDDDDEIDSHESLRAFALSMGQAKKGAVELDTAMRVYAAANRFYAKIGMDLDLQEEDRDAEFEYSDILEHGPPGTGDAPDIDSDEGAA